MNVADDQTASEVQAGMQLAPLQFNLMFCSIGGRLVFIVHPALRLVCMAIDGLLLLSSIFQVVRRGSFSPGPDYSRCRA
jgi:hypothetical protein